MSTDPVWTREQTKMLKRLVEAGVSYEEIRRRMDGRFSRAAIGGKIARMRQLGVLKCKAQSKDGNVTQSMRERIVEMYFTEKKNIYAIAKETGVLSLWVERIVGEARHAA